MFTVSYCCKGRPVQWVAYGLLGCTAAFACLYTRYLFESGYVLRVLHGNSGHITLLALALLGFTTAAEIGASFYAFVFIFSAIAYLLLRESDGEPMKTSARPCPPVGILYLCCDDFDRAALESLARLEYRGRLYLVVHDDSQSAEVRAEVAAAVASLSRKGCCEVLLLRRPDKSGGKPGALNYVLEQTGHLFEYFLLCDNDSIAVDRLAIQKALPYFQDPQVAIVQCRNIAAHDPEYSLLNRLLCRSIDVYHVFLAFYSRFGWRMFVGHNALLRTRAVLQVGGFTPGYFSDDIDLTVRLNLQGYSVIYAPQIRLGEKHPPSYDAFRRRTYKWSYGCMQILKTHTWAILTTSRLSLAEKLSFFCFAGFYIGQTVLLAYLGVHFLLGPFYLKHCSFGIAPNVIAGGVIIIVIYLPTLSYFAKQRMLRESLGSVFVCGLIYGATDFVCARGAWDCLRGRKAQWIPTNAACQESAHRDILGEAVFGLASLAVPWLAFPALLYQPCAYLFLGKFLFGPALSLLYRDQHAGIAFPARQEATTPSAWTFLLIIVAALAISSPAQAAQVEIRGKKLYVQGRPFLAKGVHYGPWRPGTGPAKRYPYPGPAEVDSDLRLIRSLNANTILVVDPPAYVLDIAERYGLEVLYAFYLEWWAIGSPEDAPARERVLRRVREYSTKSALLGWVLGNEVPVNVLAQRGRGTVERGLADLYGSIKALDRTHPITHPNWPLTKDLQLGFFDITSFNVYPLWPPEVVAMGFGAYIQRVLQPIARDKPLLVTEFGVNSLEGGEDGQARLLKQCWEGLLKAGACGGVVFEFADEWWKNYDNPKIAGFYWDRARAPEDEKTHDLDPEEYYGITDGDRRPKPAFLIVRQMFAQPARLSLAGGRVVPATIIGLLALSAFSVRMWAKRRSRSRSL